MSELVTGDVGTISSAADNLDAEAVRSAMSTSMEDRPIPTQQQISFNMANVSSRRGSQSPVDTPREEVGISDVQGERMFNLSHINGRRGSESPADMTKEENGILVIQNRPVKPQFKIMEDSLADAEQILSQPPSGNPVVSTVDMLTDASMEDSLNFLDHVEASKSKEFYVNGAHGSGDDLAAQKRHMDAVNASEIFSDPGMDFLANAGSKSGVHDSELARQSLYQNFDPFVVKSTQPFIHQSQQPPRMALAPIIGSPSPAGMGLPFRQPFPTQSHASTTGMIAAMQQKQHAFRLQQSAATDRIHQPAPVVLEPSSWPDLVNRQANPSPFSTMKDSPPLLTVNVRPQNPQQVNTPPSQTSSTSSQYHSSTSQFNGSGDFHHDMNGETRVEQYDDSYDYETPMGPPGSLVNLSLVDSSPRRPVTLRTKLTSSASGSKTMNRRSVPAGFLDGREGLMNSSDHLESHDEYSGYPELHPIWENVVATYEGLLRVTLNKLSTLQAESCDAKQKEAKAVKDQEEMHRVFVGLHERFESSKAVISTYRANQETLQRAFDDLNSEFQPVLLENKKMQAAVRLNDMRMRQLEGDLEKKNFENAELAKIVDDLISKDC